MANITAPIAKLRPAPQRAGIADELAWLENLADNETQQHLAAETQFYEQQLNTLTDQTATLFAEIKNRTVLTDSSYPCQDGDYYYYTRTEEHSEYPIHCRKLAAEGEPQEEILIDENSLATSHAYFDLAATAISPNHRYLAYAVDTVGDERYRLYIKDLRTGLTLRERFIECSSCLAWSKNSERLFFLQLDADNRPYRCYSHRLGQLACKKTLLYSEWDERFYLSLSTCKANDYLFLNAESKDSSEVHFLAFNTPSACLQLFAARQDAVRYYVEQHKQMFYVLSNEQAKNFALWQTSTTHWQRHQWQLRCAHNDAITLEEMDVFADYLVLTERHQALLKFHILHLEDASQDRYVEFTAASYSIASVNNIDVNSNILRFEYESLHEPCSLFDLDLNTLTKTLLKQQQVLEGFVSSNYISERITAVAEDGSAIPLSIVYHRHFPPTAQRPLLLYGYGAYGCSLDVWFSNARISLLNRGISFAIAHIRGGGDCGESWHEQGKLQYKENTFSDFAAAANRLCAKQYSCHEKLILCGGSAGGLLIGAVLNRYPKLCKLAIAEVPFVDVLNTMLNDNLPLTVTEYEEWGNPNETESYQRIAAYSPYENVQAQPYPILYVSCGLEDKRVPYWEAIKWTQKIRRLATNQPLIVVKINNEAGHAGASGRFQAMQEIAEQYSFLLHALEN